MRHFFCLKTVAAAVATLACMAGFALGASISPALEDALDLAGPGEFVPVVVLMSEFPHQAGFLAEARALRGDARRSFVVNRMQRLADSSQRPVHTALTAAPYVVLAKKAVPGGVFKALYKMTLKQWEKKVGF